MRAEHSRWVFATVYGPQATEVDIAEVLDEDRGASSERHCNERAGDAWFCLDVSKRALNAAQRPFHLLTRTQMIQIRARLTSALITAALTATFAALTVIALKALFASIPTQGRGPVQVPPLIVTAAVVCGT